MRTVFWLVNLKGRDPSEEENVRMDLREIRWKGVKWIHLVQVRDRC
jgi:hypothetical protein